MNVNSYLINKYIFMFLNKTNVSDLVLATLNNIRIQRTDNLYELLLSTI